MVEKDKENPDEQRIGIRPEKKISSSSGFSEGNRISGVEEASSRIGDSNATGRGRIGGGIGFDFYSPPDFNKEMAKAREKVRVDEENHRLEKFTNPGHGVICNTKGYWFICKKKDIEACNAAHDNMCRYAKKKERETLDQTVFF